MEKNCAVYRSEKGKNNGGGLGNHIDRTKGMEHTFENADPEKTHLNIDYTHKKYKHLPLEKAINESIKINYKGKKAIRKDAVRYIQHVLTGSHEQMIKIFSNEKKKNEWIKANYEFIKEEFGEKNIVRFVLHLDEKTPHLHVVTTPITEDGRMSAKHFMNGRKLLSNRQTKYANKMEKFGLTRGISSVATKRKHENAKEFNNRVNRKQTKAFEKDLKPSKTLGFVSKSKTIEKYKDKLEEYQKNINTLEQQNKRMQEIYFNIKKEIERKEEILNESQKENRELKNIKSMFINSLKYKGFTEQYRKRFNVDPKPQLETNQILMQFAKERNRSKFSIENIENLLNYKFTESQKNEIEKQIYELNLNLKKGLNL